MSSFDNILWNKSKYQSLEQQQQQQNTNYVNGNSQSIITLLLIGLLGTAVITTMWSIHSPTKATIFLIDTKLPMLHKTSTRFLSFGLDSSLLRDPKTLPINNEAFMNLAKYLSPAYARIGGTSADCIFFKQNSDDISRTYDKFDPNDITNFTLTEEFYLNLYKFTEKK